MIVKDKIVVVIPYGPDQNELALKAAKVHKVRAGIDCEVFIFEDIERKGWVAMHNDLIKKLKFDYYLFSCADYFPSRNYLKSAFEWMIKCKKGLCAFNDGKWGGLIATVGLISKKYVDKLYGNGDLFHPGYVSHYADTELTAIAANDKQICYNPDAILMEVDYDKEDKKVRIRDRILFHERKKKLFDNRVDKKYAGVFA